MYHKRRFYISDKKSQNNPTIPFQKNDTPLCFKKEIGSMQLNFR